MGSDSGLTGDDQPTIRGWWEDLTYDEVHSMELGLLGIFAAVAIHLGYIDVAVYGSILLIAIAFGVCQSIIRRVLPGELRERCKSECKTAVARKIIRAEPWYFTTVFIVSSVVTHVVIEWGVL